MCPCYVIALVIFCIDIIMSFIEGPRVSVLLICKHLSFLFQVEETEAEKEARLKKWENFLESGETNTKTDTSKTSNSSDGDSVLTSSETGEKPAKSDESTLATNEPKSVQNTEESKITEKTE